MAALQHSSVFADADQPMPWVATSIRPLALIAEELLQPVAPDRVVTIVPRSASPHGFTLQPSDLKLILQSPVLVWLGPSFEPYIEKALRKRSANMPAATIALENLEGVHLLAGRELGNDTIEALAGDDEHDHHGHDHQGADPHLWWDSGNAVVLAQALTEVLIELHPQQESALKQSLNQFMGRLLQAKALVMTVKKAQQSQNGFLNYHDSLLYLEHELGIHSQRRIAKAPEDKPSVKDMMALVTWLNENRVACVITEPGVNPQLITKLNARGNLKEVVIDPQGWDAAGYTDMWLGAAQKILACLSASE